nr:hypothetical protein [Aeromonas veronii]
MVLPLVVGGDSEGVTVESDLHKWVPYVVPLMPFPLQQAPNRLTHRQAGAAEEARHKDAIG